MIDVLVFCLIVILLPTVIGILFMVGVVVVGIIGTILEPLTRKKDKW